MKQYSLNMKVIEPFAKVSGELVREYKGEWELFDMEADRLETNNLIMTYPETAKSLMDEYSKWAKRADVKEWLGRQTPIGGMSRWRR